MSTTGRSRACNRMRYQLGALLLGALAALFLPTCRYAEPDPVARFIQERMRPASAAFFAPSPMHRDDSYEAMLEIAPPTVSPAELEDELRQVARQHGVTAAGFIKAAPRMVANLSADRACIITPKDPLDRAVASGERVRWRWTVTPKVAGAINLTATLNAPVILDGKETSYSIRSFDETVTVTVTNRQRASDVVEYAKNHWAMLTVAGGGLLALLRWLWKRKQRPAPPAPPSFE